VKTNRDPHYGLRISTPSVIEIAECLRQNTRLCLLPNTAAAYYIILCLGVYY
jgi:hypothetical protein